MDEYLKHVRWAELRVGIIISAGLLIFFFAVLFASRVAHLFETQAMVSAVFSDVGGLQIGAPVRFSGLDVGKVQSLELKGPGRVEVSMSIVRRTLDYLKSDSTAVIAALDLFSSMYVGLTAGSREGKPLKPGAVINGTTQPSFQEITGTAKQNLEKLVALTEKLDRLALTLQEGEGTLPRLIRDPTLYGNLLRATEKLRAIADRVERGQGRSASWSLMIPCTGTLNPWRGSWSTPQAP